MKKICFFGIYDRDYPRNKVLIEGFERNGFKVLHCNVNPKIYKGFYKYWLLLMEASKIKINEVNFVFVAFPGHTCVWLAKLLFPTRKIVLDVFVSQYSSNVVDRQAYKVRSITGRKDYFLDWYSIRMADIVVLDTNEHICAFNKKYGLKYEKSIRVFLGSALPAIDHPKDTTGRREFIVHYHGTYIPLHGVEYIVRSAKILEGNSRIVFRMVGFGQQFEEMKVLAKSLDLKNIEFLGRLPEYKDVLERINDCDVLLGAFSTTERGQWVIMNKIFEGMVFGKAIISAETPAMKELFIDRDNILFCEAGNTEDLAEKILILEKDKELKEKIGLGALNLFKRELSPEKLIANFLLEIKNKI